ATRVEADEARELRDPEDLVARDVADERAAMERQPVMLAESVEADRSFDDLRMASLDAVRPFAREQRAELGIAVVARRCVVQRLEKALRRLARAGRIEIEAERGENLGCMPLEALPFVCGPLE